MNKRDKRICKREKKDDRRRTEREMQEFGIIWGTENWL